MNAEQVWRTLYGKPLSAVKYKFKVGDQVKISKHKRTFEKSYLPNWSEETFAVAERLARDPPVYKLKKHDGELIKGTFYETELQKEYCSVLTEQSDTQAYNAYIKTILNFTEQAKKSYLTKALYYKDTAGHMDEVDNTAENNIGLQKRGVFTNNGAEVGLVGVPLYDIFNVDKLLLDGLEIKVKVDLNSDTFVLMGGETPNNCMLQIMSGTLRVRTVRMADSAKLEHLQIMQGQKGCAALPAVYTLTRTPTHAKIIPRGLLNHTETDLFNGLIPQCVIFGMVRNDVYNGHLTRNPFNFQLFDLQGVRLTVNGEEMPYSALELTGGKKIDGYNTLFSGSGDMNCGHGLDIDRLDWENGYGLLRVDLTPAGSGHPDHLIPHRSGNVNLYLKFGTQTETVLNLIVYEEFQNQLEIDRNRRVVYDLSQGS
ncbi:uncharacterized protein [Montipora capricornis]|uniref:uncharacterized protein n=1 Tax=Montipora capricornis TaxID=246305 RepID=UPI0035F210D1